VPKRRKITKELEALKFAAFLPAGFWFSALCMIHVEISFVHFTFKIETEFWKWIL